MSVPSYFAHQGLHSLSPVIEPVTTLVGRGVQQLALSELPSPEVLFDVALRGWMDVREVEQVLEAHGIFLNTTGNRIPARGFVPPDWEQSVWLAAYYSRQELPTPDQVFTLTNRGLLSPLEMDAALQRLGFVSPRVRTDLENLRYEIPSSSDLVRFSVRHVFEPDLIAHLGYNDEFRPILDMWHKFQGLNYPIFSGPFRQQVSQFEESRGLVPGSFIESYAAAGIEDPTWAQAFWWSHWVLPSPTQGYEMLFRLRPDRNRAFDPPFARDLNFGLEDLALLLRANDYPPFYRAPLAAIAHRIPGIRFLRQLRSTNVFSRADVVDLLRRQGYSDGDAEVLAESVERNNRDQQRRSVEQQAKGQIAKYWELGIISRDQYVQMLVDHGLSPEDAQAAANLGEIDLQSKRVEKILAYVHRQFASGVLDAQAAARNLTDVGVTPERTALYIADWNLEVKARHREVSAARAMKWACQGLIGLDELSIRLSNLHYDQQDVAALRAEATLCQQALAGKAANELAKRQRQQIAALKAAQRQAAQAIQASRRQLASHGTPAQLRKWYCEGHLGEGDLYARLRFLQWPDDDIARLVGDCKSGLGQQSGKRGSTTTGGGTVSGGPGGGP